MSAPCPKRKAPKPKCQHCGSENVQWGKTKAGKWALYDTEPRIHFASCKKRPARVPDSDPVQALIGLGLLVREARALVAESKGKDFDTIVKECLRKMVGDG